MSGDDLEVVRRYYEASDLAEAIDLLASDVTFVFRGKSRGLAGAETISGKKAAVAWLTDWFSRFERDYSVTVEEARDLGDCVLVVTHHRAAGRASGAPIDQRTTQIMAVEGGKITRQEFFWSLDEALEARGRSEQRGNRIAAWRRSRTHAPGRRRSRGRDPS